MRKSGILLPITSLPSEYGIGCFSVAAYRVADFLKASGQGYWQILPLGPTGYGDSPYQSFSTFAGNSYMISLEELIEEGLLTKEECDDAQLSQNINYIDYKKQYTNRIPLLKTAASRWNFEDVNYKAFCEENSYWLEDYALFCAIKEQYNGKPLLMWDEKIIFKNQSVLDELKNKHDASIKYHKFTQYKFYSQWFKLKSYVNKLGIEIIGDIPIYVSSDSSDLWNNPELFDLDETEKPINVAGCPPDGFSPKGQLWGNPLYKWEAHRKDGYKWWIKRIEHSFKMYDALRIDHFRGFDEYYSIPFESEDATKGIWKKGPGKYLFDAIENALGKKNIIAEDLGFITPSVVKLLKDTVFPGMKVLQFAFDTRDTGDANSYLPHNYPANCVAYTGTHDNQTLYSWFHDLPAGEKLNVRQYLCDCYTPDFCMNDSLIGLIMRSNAYLTIIPIQDWLGLGDEARINTPSTVGNNWTWRLNPNQLDDTLQKKILNMTKIYGRL